MPSKKTPVYVLDTFSAKAGSVSFYLEKFKTHLKDHAFINRPHKHDFYLILFFTQGTGTHIIDFQSFGIKPGVVFAMTPGQVHSWTLSADTDGYIIFFKPDFYQMQLREQALIEFPFFHSLNANPCIEPGKDKMMDAILDEMYHEFKAHDTPDLRILRSYLDILLLKLARKYKHTPGSRLQTNIHKIRKVEQLIENNFRTMKHPHQYAALMNLTPSYLSNICKESLGKTLSDLIYDRIILEAKRLFAYTDLSIKEIALDLGYMDSSYFTRFFKKNTGLTPDHFKESINRPV